LTAGGDGNRLRRPGNPKESPMTAELVLVDRPLEHVLRITMNRPEKRNALFHPLRGAILQALQAGDLDDDIKVMIIRGAGPSFCAGYDLGSSNQGNAPYPHFTAPGEGRWPRHVTESWMSIWDLGKPVIAQVHGYCLAGGSELATGCDLVYMADDAQMGYPAVRFGVPDMHFHPWFLGMRKAMEMYMTGNVRFPGPRRCSYGWANASFPAERLEEEVLAIASEIARIPLDVLQLNKRAIHRQMEAMGLRNGIRAGTEICALGIHTQTMAKFIGSIEQHGLTGALDRRDGAFGDYRTSGRDVPVEDASADDEPPRTTGRDYAG
jgi:enoyl-CoA hydratase